MSHRSPIKYALLSTIALLTLADARVQWSGVQLFGLASDASIFGTVYSEFESTNCQPSFKAYPYYDPTSNYDEWRALGFNLFRLPMSWQHVQTGLGKELNETTMKDVDSLVSYITSNGSQAIIDIHNYARWNCAVIGQPDLSFLNPNITVADRHFIDLWTKLATRYSNNTNVIFQLMNEPHDLNITTWGHTNQKAINAIRRTDAKNRILVSGTQFARLSNWLDFSAVGIGPGLIHDPANNTLYDFHQYFDDIGGAYGLCEPWSGFAKSFNKVTKLLRKAGYQAMLTEFGGGPFSQCVELFTELLGFLDKNSDVWYGWTAWGSFNPGPLYLSTDSKDPTYKLVEVLKR